MTCSTESEEQIGFINWFHGRFPGVLIFHIPNGGFRNTVTAKRLKREGVVPGIPDLYIPRFRLWVEMKRKESGVVSEDQLKIHQYLKRIGDMVIVGYGATDASIKVLKFIEADAAKQITYPC